MTTAAEFDAARLEALRARFSGPLLSSADEGYDDARQVHNGPIDRRPALIARCHDSADIVAVLPAVWVDPAETEANVAWTRETHAAVAPDLAEGRWLNYLGDDEGNDAVRAAYGPNYDRLVEVKRRYDPGNVFRQNHNIVP